MANNCEVLGCKHEASHYFLCDVHYKELLEFPRAAMDYHFGRTTKTRYTVKRDVLAILHRKEPPGSINFKVVRVLEGIQQQAEAYRARKEGRPPRAPRESPFLRDHEGRGPM